MRRNSGSKIDPKTGDYIIENGDLVPDTSILQPIYIRYKCKRLGWLYAPNTSYGSDFHLIKKVNTTQPPIVEVNVAQKALQPLIEDGRLLSVEIDVTSRGRGYTLFNTNAVEILNNEETQTTSLIPVGFGV